MAESQQTTFFELVHKIDLGGEGCGKTQVVQGIEVAAEDIVHMPDDGFLGGVGHKLLLLRLEIPFFRQVHRRVPVDELCNLDGDGERNVVADAQLHFLPRFRLEDK